MPNGRVVTLDDVAREAGVSASTASRALNGRSEQVGVETRTRVQAVATRLGYAANLAAQAVALGRSRSIGLIASSLPDDYQNPVLAGIFGTANTREMLVTTALARVEDVERMRRAVRHLRGQRPSVVIAIVSEMRGGPGVKELLEELQHVEDEGGRVVLIGLRDSAFDSVTVDDVNAGQMMAQSLLEVGYTDFAVLADARQGQLSVERVTGFAQGVASAGIELSPDRVLYQEFSHDGGYRGAGELLRRRSLPQAVFCVNDAMAIGASVRFREQGLAIGLDIAVAGCDDIPALRDIDPPLSSLRLPWTEAAEHALSLSEHPKSAARHVVLNGYPVLRASTPGMPPADSSSSSAP